MKNALKICLAFLLILTFLTSCDFEPRPKEKTDEFSMVGTWNHIKPRLNPREIIFTKNKAFIGFTKFKHKQGDCAYSKEFEVDYTFDAKTHELTFGDTVKTIKLYDSYRKECINLVKSGRIITDPSVEFFQYSGMSANPTYEVETESMTFNLKALDNAVLSNRGKFVKKQDYSF